MDGGIASLASDGADGRAQIFRDEVGPTATGWRSDSLNETIADEEIAVGRLNGGSFFSTEHAKSLAGR